MVLIIFIYVCLTDPSPVCPLTLSALLRPVLLHFPSPQPLHPAALPFSSLPVCHPGQAALKTVITRRSQRSSTSRRWSRLHAGGSNVVTFFMDSIIDSAKDKACYTVKASFEKWWERQGGGKALQPDVNVCS